MSTILKPLPKEILANVVDHVKTPHQAHQWDDPNAERLADEERSTLVVLTHTSKTMKALAVREMYRDCIVNNTAAFLHRVKAGPPFDGIERLQLYIGSSMKEIGYGELLAEGWTLLEVKTFPKQRWRDPTSLMNEMDAMAYVATGLRHRILDGHSNILPRLRRVVLGGIGERGWNSQDAKSAITAGQINPRTRGVAHLLLDLPSVQHLCQYYDNGPLSLGGYIIKPEHPVRTYDFHPRPFLVPSPHTPRGPEDLPIIIGATNRYFFEKTTFAFAGSHSATDGTHQQELLDPLLPMLCPGRKGVLATSVNTLRARAVSLDDVDTTGTVIEIYDLARLVNRAHYAETEMTARTGKYHLRPPQSLAGLQATLDAHVHPAWRGKVFLRNREDAPPCSACGFDVNKEWKYVTTNKCVVGKVQMLACPGHI